VLLNVSHSLTKTVELAEVTYSLHIWLLFRKHIHLIPGQAAFSPIMFRFQNPIKVNITLTGIQVMKHFVVPLLFAPDCMLLWVPSGQFLVRKVGQCSRALK
jgi:hypothetical protein